MERIDSGMNTLLLAAMISLTNGFGSVSIDTLGANVMSYVPNGGTDVLFRQSAAKDPAAWYNGGVPICWPWFNRQGDPGTVPHGFVRLREWKPVLCKNGEQESKAVLRLEEVGKYRLDYEVVLNESLSLKLVMKNLGNERFVVTTGLHPYFTASDPDKVKVTTPTGKVIACHAGIDGGLQFGEGVYLVDDIGLNRRLALKMFGNNKFIIWNIGAEETLAGLEGDDWKHYVCVEPAVIPRADGFYLNPGEERSIGLVCTVSKLGK